MNKTRVWIHCRVSKESLHFLLHHQEYLLKSMCEASGLNIVAIAKEVSSGKDMNTKAMKSLITEIRRGRIDVVLIYDKTRLFVYEDKYMEFQMLCEANDILIADLQDFHTLLPFIKI